MPEIRDIEWGECLVEPKRDPELERYVRREFGVVPPSIPYLAHCPWLARSLVWTNARRSLLVHVDVALAELAFLVVSQDNSCRYCYASQRALLRISGFSEERIRRIEEDWLAADLSPRDRIALEFARRVSRASPRPGVDDLEPLHAAGWNADGIRELAFVAAITVSANRITTILGIPPGPAEEFADRWWVRLIRPLLAARLNSRTSRGAPERLAPEERVGPYSRLICSLDGLPAAPVLRRTLDAAWESPMTSRRAKGLVFAVVARTLGCGLSEREARDLLAPAGLDEGPVEEILTHLSSPKLDEVESAIVPFARETAWAHPTQLQRRAADLRQLLDQPSFVEIVGVAGAANAICRMGFLAEGT